MSGATAWRVVALAVALLATACESGARSRYVLVSRDGSRHSIRDVVERSSGVLVHLHCELRVPLARTLPEPISTPATGDLMSIQYLTPATMSSADLDPSRSRERDGYRVWLRRTRATASDYEGSASLGVQLKFPLADSAMLRTDAMEIFNLPALESLVPHEWSPWRGPNEIRAEEHPGWNRLEGTAPVAPATHPAPFELRCRTVLRDELFTPIEAEDPDVGKPDPRAQSALIRGFDSFAAGLEPTRPVPSLARFLRPS